MSNLQTSKYAQMGLAALLPGMQYMIEQMQCLLDEQRALLARLQDDSQPGEKSLSVNRKRRAGAKNAWSGMTAEERSREMKRRIRMRAKKAHAASVMSKDHPDHAKWAAKQRRARKKAWAAKSAAEKKRWVQAMQAGKAKAAAAPYVNGRAS